MPITSLTTSLEVALRFFDAAHRTFALPATQPNIRMAVAAQSSRA
jgi:hypothetical protein